MVDKNMGDLANQFIAESGIDVEKFFIEITPYSEMVGYTDEEGREFDLPISDENLGRAVRTKLKELGVRVIELK